MFRFTIRDVLWLTVVVGMGAAWWLERRSVEASQVRHRSECQKKIDELEMTVRTRELMLKHFDSEWEKRFTVE